MNAINRWLDRDSNLYLANKILDAVIWLIIGIGIGRQFPLA